jgi:hypothetical protein
VLLTCERGLGARCSAPVVHVIWKCYAAQSGLSIVIREKVPRAVMEGTARGIISGVSLPRYEESRTALLTMYAVPKDVSVLT